MQRTLEKRADTQNPLGVQIDLPLFRWGILGHIRNIDYCIEQLKNSKPDFPVIGYWLMRSMGTYEDLHCILTSARAMELKLRDTNFSYITIGDLLTRKAEIEAGKYRLHKGLIVGLSPEYDAK